MANIWVANRELAPTWVTESEIDESRLTTAAQELLAAVWANPWPAAPTVRIRLHLSERQLIERDWEIPYGPLSAARRYPSAAAYIAALESIYGAEALDRRRIQAWGWGDLSRSQNGGVETVEAYLNRNAQAIHEVGEIVPPGPAPIPREAAAALGRMSTEAKAAAARENGRKGGRPRKHT